MRFRHRDGTDVCVGYGTNVHPAEDLAGVIAQLDRYASAIRQRLGVDRLGLALWLARDVVTELLSQPGGVDRLRSELDRRGLEVVTLNAFPYRGFQRPVVKQAVYSPDWADPARLAYTLDCARVLAGLLPDDAARGSLSTLPFGWAPDWTAARGDAARRQVDDLAHGLAKLAADTGRPVRVGLEPEPGCVIEHTSQVARHLAGADPEWIGVCLDTCHLAVGWEDPAEALTRLGDTPVVKVQASCALEADGSAARSALRDFVEPRFLHQTSEYGAGAVDDLPAALGGALPGTAPWRTHFHVPVHADPSPPLRSTQPVLVDALARLFGGAVAVTDHVEVETYTWSVLPGAPDVVEGIAAELAWTRDQLLCMGLT